MRQRAAGPGQRFSHLSVLKVRSSCGLLDPVLPPSHASRPWPSVSLTSTPGHNMVGTNEFDEVVHKTQMTTGIQSIVNPGIGEPSKPIASDPAGEPHLYLFLYLPTRWTYGEDRGASGTKQSDHRSYPRVPVLEGYPLI